MTATRSFDKGLCQLHVAIYIEIQPPSTHRTPRSYLGEHRRHNQLVSLHEIGNVYQWVFAYCEF